MKHIITTLGVLLSLVNKVENFAPITETNKPNPIYSEQVFDVNSMLWGQATSFEKTQKTEVEITPIKVADTRHQKEKVILPQPKPSMQEMYKQAQTVVNNAYIPVLGDTSGYTAGNFSVSDGGAATYSIPITVTPGTAGMEPKLSLTYSSQGGNELLGAGWSLQGMSIISRSTKTIAQDGIVKGIDFTSNDTYSLDGERIIPVLGVNGTEYRTEQNAFIRIKTSGNQNGSPSYFTVQTQDGLELELGNTNDSRIEAQGSNHILFWLVNKIRDTKGNYITFSYFEDNITGEYYPTQISYTGNDLTGRLPYATVLFNYSNRQDTKIGYIAGYQMKTSKLINSISSYYQSSLFRSYSFIYTNASQSKTSLLSSIKECGTNGFCFKPTHFYYGNENSYQNVAGFTSLYAADLNGVNRIPFDGEWNGDDKTDILVFDAVSGSNKWYQNKATLATATNIIPTADLANGMLFPNDWNGDGFTDILWFNGSNNSYKFFINNRPNNFSSLSFTQQNTGLDFSSFPIGGATSIEMGDFDGNGQMDVLLYAQNTGATRLFLNKTGGQMLTFNSISNTIVPTNAISGGTMLVTMDVNEDGLEDLFWYDEVTGNNRWFMNQGINTSGLTTFASAINNPIASNLLSGGDKIDFGDWNGDGLSDIIWYDGTTGASRWFYNKGQPANGASNFPQEINAVLPANLITGSGIDLHIVDFNKDGLSDIVRYRKTDGTNHWFKNKGNCDFSTPLKPSQPSTPGYSNWITPSQITGGEGISFHYYEREASVFWYNKVGGSNSFKKIYDYSQFKNQMLYIVNGHGQTTSIIYTPLGASDVYTKERNASFPMYDMGGDFTVVSEVQSDAGLNTSLFPELQHRISYKYKGAKLHTQGRGFRGFHEIEATNHATDIVSRKVQSLDYRYIGAPLDTLENVLIETATFDFPLLNQPIDSSCWNSINGMGNEIGVLNIPAFPVGSKIISASLKVNGIIDPTAIGISNGDLLLGLSGAVSTSMFNSQYATYNVEPFVFYYPFINSNAINLSGGIVHLYYCTGAAYNPSIMPRPVFPLGNKAITLTIKYTTQKVVSRTVNQNSLKLFTTQIPNLNVHYSYTSSSNTKDYDLNGAVVSNQTTRETYDDYGNPLTIVVEHGNGVVDSSSNVYNNHIFNGKWLLGRLSNSTITKSAPNVPTLSRQSAFIYDTISGLRKQDILDANLGINQKVTSEYVFDNDGNIIQSTETAWNGQLIESLISTKIYDSQGRFQLSQTNALGHTSSATYDPVLGLPLTITDANGRTTTFEYDGFGRKTKETYADGNWTALDYRLCSNDTTIMPNLPNTPVHAKTFIYKQASNHPPTITWYDMLGREIRTQGVGFNGTPFYTDIEYNISGKIISNSVPYFMNTTPSWTYHYYDGLGRDTLSVHPGNRLSRTQHNGLETKGINALNQSNRVVKDVAGRLITVYDNQNNPINYQYDAAGKMTKIIDPLGNMIQFQYDIFGNKTQMIDPERGVENYQYNQWGYLIQSTDAKGAIQRYQYDKLGRMTERIQPEDTTTWVFDTAPNGIGALASVSSTSGHAESYSYDIYGRLISKTEIINDSSYKYQYTYQSDGRKASMQYPSGLKIRNEYNAQGYLAEVRNDANNQLYWRADSYNAKGQLLQKTLGNGLVTTYNYDNNEDWLQQIITSNPNGSNVVQNLSFQFDALGNLTQRRDNKRNLEENISYDNLNRMVQTRIAGIDTLNMQYDILGNITYKSDVGSYFYNANNAGPHKLTSIQTNSPNVCIPSFLANFTYTSFDKVKQIQLDTARLVLDYGIDQQRIIQKLYRHDSLSEIKYYIGDLYEKKIKNGVTYFTHYIPGGDGIAAVYNTLSTGAVYTHYWHKDHLGSLQSVSDANGNLVEELAYDAWGKRRNADWTPIVGISGASYDRGFTGHEHIDIFSLINMNGRVYDPILGRFIQADPFIQDILDLQNLNRYSYVNNNPLSYTDPSGYLFKKLLKKVAQAIKSVVKAVGHAIKNVGKAIGKTVGSALKQAGHFLKKHWKEIVVVAVAVGVGVLTGGAGVILSGAAAGFASSTTGALLNGASFSSALKAGLRGSVIGGVTAGLTSGVGIIAADIATQNVVAGFAAKVVGHGIVQGGMNAIHGGSFTSGFLSGSFAAGVAPFSSEINSATGRVIAGAIAGGTASALGGGKFSNGAISGSFVAMYNQNKMGDKDAAKKFMDCVKNAYHKITSWTSDHLEANYSLSIGTRAGVDVGGYGMNVGATAMGFQTTISGGEMYSSITDPNLNGSVSIAGKSIGYNTNSGYSANASIGNGSGSINSSSFSVGAYVPGIAVIPFITGGAPVPVTIGISVKFKW